LKLSAVEREINNIFMWNFNEIVTQSSAFHTSAVSHIHFSMIVPFKTPIARKEEAFRLWDFDRWSANDWALHTEIEKWFCFQMMSNYMRMTGHTWSYRLLNVKLTIYLCEISSLMTENIKFTQGGDSRRVDSVG
jgi:hypothetical protein